MTLNYLLYLSSMIVLITSMPNIPPTTETTEAMTETPDPHNEDSIDDPCAEGNITIANDEESYELGELLGIYRPSFYSLDYGVNGSFYTIKDHPQKIFIGNFSYNGNAPLVYFYVGLTINSGVNHFYVPSDYHTYDPCNITDGFLIGNIHKHENKSVIITLPQNFTVHNIRWIMVWCRVFALDMGHVWNNHYNESSRRKRDVEENAEDDDSDSYKNAVEATESSSPEATDMHHLGKIAGRLYDVKGDIYVIDSTTLFLSNFSYNGKAPDAYFYAGDTEKIGGNGTIIPDENGSNSSIGVYVNQNITLQLPDGFTIKDFKWLSIFCDSFLQDFGHIRYDYLDFDELLDRMDVKPIDTITSENQTETNVLESNDLSHVSEELEEETVTVSSQDYYESEKELEMIPEPEPGDANLLQRAEKSKSKGMALSLTSTSEYVMAITIALYFLLR